VNNLLRKFKTMCQSAGIDNICIHDLRRLCITNWARQGVPIHVAQKLAGHSDIQTTQKYYLSVSEEDLHRAREVQQKLVAGLPVLRRTDQKLTKLGPKRNFLKRRVFSVGTEVPVEMELM
jgi:integrase